MVRVRENGHEWLGFVYVGSLKEPVLEGRTFVEALVLEIEGEKFKAQLPGLR